jgi:hypothetical protein
MSIKKYIAQNLTDFRFILLIDSNVFAVPKYANVNGGESSIRKSTTRDSSNFGVNSSSDFIYAIEFIFIPILILFGIAVGLYHWRKRISKRYKQQAERLGTNLTSENRPSHSTPQTDSQLRRDEPRESSKVEEEYDIESLEKIALNDIKNARCFRERGEISEYCTAISWAIKKYVGEKYHIKVAGASTGQVLENLPQELTDSVFDYVGEILRTCDMINLAQHRPSRGELDHIYQIATEFIQKQIQPDDTENDTEAEEPDEPDERIEPPGWFQRYR